MLLYQQRNNKFTHISHLNENRTCLSLAPLRDRSNAYSPMKSKCFRVANNTRVLIGCIKIRPLRPSWSVCLDEGWYRVLILNEKRRIDEISFTISK